MFFSVALYFHLNYGCWKDTRKEKHVLKFKVCTPFTNHTIKLYIGYQKHRNHRQHTPRLTQVGSQMSLSVSVKHGQAKVYLKLKASVKRKWTRGATIRCYSISKGTARYRKPYYIKNDALQRLEVDH